MIYHLQVRSIPQASESAIDKHQRFLTRLPDIARIFGVGLGKVPALKAAPDEEIATVPLTAAFGRRAKGDVLYTNRGYLEARAKFDDSLSLDFKPELLTLESGFALLKTAVEALDAYYGVVEDEEFVFLSIERTGVVDVRNRVARVSPLSFFGDELLTRVLKMTREEFKRRLERYARVEESASGVFVVGSVWGGDFEQAKVLGDALTWALLGEAEGGA